jgi:tetratricopeptide (TPR) repeat protein
LCRLFKNYKPKFEFLSIPFLATMFFAAHPLHTEIVANIKGRDEILAFLFSILALNSILNYTEKNKFTALISAFIFIFLASMSKEISITFLAVIPLSIYFFRKEKFSKLIIITIPLLAGAGLYLIFRSIAIGNQTGIEASMLMNNPFLEATTTQRYATVFLTLLIYLKLLIFPHPLTWDYYPYHIPIVDWADWRVILALVLYLSLAGIAIYGFRKKSIYSYCILIYLITLSITSNLFFNIGAFMSERFVYVSLLGFCVIFAYLISEKLAQKILNIKKYKNLSISIFVFVLIAFSLKTYSRNFDWKDNLTLFGHDVKVSINSAKGNSTYASELYKLSEDAEQSKDTLLRNKYLKEAIPYFEKALEIYPDYSEALIRLGNIYYKLDGDYKKMMDYYLKTLETNPLNADVWANAKGVLNFNVDEPEYEKFIWKRFSELSPDYYESYFQIGSLYYFEGVQKADSVIFWLEKSKSLNSNHFETLFYLGISYGNINNIQKARENLLKAVEISPNIEAYRYLGISYGMEDDDKTALSYFEKALSLDPNNEVIKGYVDLAKSRLN